MKRIEYEDQSVKIILREDGSLTWDSVSPGYTPGRLIALVDSEIYRLNRRAGDLQALAEALEGAEPGEQGSYPRYYDER